MVYTLFKTTKINDIKKKTNMKKKSTSSVSSFYTQVAKSAHGACVDKMYRQQLSM